MIPCHFFIRRHYANTPMQYTAIFHGCKSVNFKMIFLKYFSYFCSKHRLWVHVRTASVRRLLRVPTIYVLEQKYENNVYPCKPQIYYIKVGCKRVYNTRTCSHDDELCVYIQRGNSNKYQQLISYIYMGKQSMSLLYYHKIPYQSIICFYF